MAPRRVLLDLSPLRDSRQFRLLYAGQIVSVFGRQLTVVASALQVFFLTDSSLAVGLLSLAQLGPLVVCSVLGGPLADAMDRRKLLLWTQVALAATSIGLALNADRGDPALWPIFVFTAVAAGVSAVDGPTRTAVVPSLVGRDQIVAAQALGQAQFQLAQIVGPALAGLVIARVDLAAAYWIDAASFGIAIVGLLLMERMVPEGGGTRAGLGSAREGLRYIKGQPAIQGAFLVDINAMVFGMPRALFPELGTELFGGGPGTVGMLYAAPGVGALFGAVTTGWVNRVRRHGRAVLVAVAVWGAAIAGFGLVRWLPVALALLAVAGAADVISAVLRGTIIQLQVPDRLRGRLWATNIAVVTGGPRLGDAEAGAVAAVAGPQVSVVSGGLACIAGVVVLNRLLPGFNAWTPPPVESE